MTTPNIKALAEQIKKNYEAQPDHGDPEYRIENASYELASALLRVLEDANDIASAIEPIANSPLYTITARQKGLMQTALESHNKLLEELEGE